MCGTSVASPTDLKLWGGVLGSAHRNREGTVKLRDMQPIFPYCNAWWIDLTRWAIEIQFLVQDLENDKGLTSVRRN